MNDAANVIASDLTTSTVARALDCSEGTVRNMARRGELPSVRLSSNSHQDFFIKNLVAIRAEERLALAVYREAAFGHVTGLE